MRRLTLIGAIALVVVVLFGVTELVLPPLAKHIAKDRLSKYGRVESLSISAFPAVEFVWGHAGSMTVKMDSYQASGTRLSNALSQSEQVGTIHATIGTLHSGLITMQNVTAVKRGKTFTISGDLTDADFKSAISVLDSVHALGESNGALVLSATGTVPLLGTQITADVDVSPSDGALVAAAQGVLGSLLGNITLFSNPRLYITAVSGHAVSGGLTITASGQLR